MNDAVSGSLECFRQVKLVAVLEAVAVEPCSGFDAYGVDDKRIALPFADRMPHEGGILVDIFRVFAIDVNRPIHEVVFEQNRNDLRTLDDLKWRRPGDSSRRTRRQTKPVRV